MLDQIGHLSNTEAGKLISNLANSGLKNIMLGHLSKENNFPDLAYRTVLAELSLQNISTQNINLSVAGQFNPSKVIDVS